MTSLLSAVLSVFSFVIIGYIIKKLNIIPPAISKKIDFISFNILLPIALVTNFWLIEFPNIVIYKLIFAFFGSGVIVFIIGFLIGKNLYQFIDINSALFGLGACLATLLLLASH